MTDLFREVEEDLRREQFSKLWDKYGVYVIAAAAAIVLLAAIVVGWRTWSHSQRVEASARFDEVVKAAETASPDEAAAAFEAFADGTSGGYATLARLREADKRLEAGERDVALGIYDDVANGSSLEIIRGMAVIKAGLLRVDTASYDDMKARLTPLIERESPWRENALELLALSATREGVWEDANRHAQAIIDNPATPSGLRDRAHVIQALVAPNLPRVDAAPDTDTGAQPEIEPETQDAPAPEAPAETE